MLVVLSLKNACIYTNLSSVLPLLSYGPQASDSILQNMLEVLPYFDLDNADNLDFQSNTDNDVNQLIIQTYYSDLIRHLELPKEFSEISSTRIKERILNHLSLFI